MKNLENYGVLEMNTKEMKETDGGIFGWDDVIIIGVSALVGALLTQDLGDLADAYNEGYDSY